MDSLIHKTESQTRVQRYKTQFSNKTHRSCSDPDATLAAKAGKEQALRYKIHTTIDADSRVILDCYATTGSVHDSQVYIERIEYIKENYDINPNFLIADRAYGAAKILTELYAKNISPVIPLFHRDSGKNKNLKGFTYDENNDQYICPAGNILKKIGKISNESQKYQAKQRDCSICDFKSTCCSGKVKQINRSIHQKFYEKHIKFLNDINYTEKMNERMWKIEGINAEAKNLHTMLLAKFRSLKKVQIQAYFVAIVQNIKRIVHSCAKN